MHLKMGLLHSVLFDFAGSIMVGLWLSDNSNGKSDSDSGQQHME
jgi:hypothetical protein